MCCLLELAMTGFGIYTLINGVFQVSRDRTVTGGPAYLIGVLLTLTLPLALGIGVAIGFTLAVTDQEGPIAQDDGIPALAFMDLAVIGAISITVIVISSINGKRKSKPTTPSNVGPFITPPPPSDPQNPYSPPWNG